MKSTNHLGRHLRTLFAITILGALAPLGAKAQFQKAYDDNFSYALHGECVRPTSDGGYIQTGFIQYWSNLTNVVLHKTDGSGVTQWIKALHSSNASAWCEDRAYSVREVPRGVWYGRGYVIVGTTKDASTTNDVLVIRTDSVGNILWRKAYQTTGEDIAYDVDLMPSNDYWQEYDFIITGHMKASGQLTKRLSLLRVDPLGTALWCKRYGVKVGADPNSVGYSVKYLASSGDIVVTGNTDPDWGSAGLTPSTTPCVLRTNGNGTKIWGKVYQTPQHDSREREGTGRGIIEASGGDLVVAGWMNGYDTQMRDAFVLRIFPSTGLVRWFTRYDAKTPSTSSYNDFGFNVRETSAGDLVLAGTSDYMISNGGPYTFMALLNGSGNVSTLYPPQRYTLKTVIDPLSGTYPQEACVSMNQAGNGFITSTNALTSGLYLIETNATLGSGGCQETIPLEEHSFSPTLVNLDSLANGCTTQNLDYDETNLDINPDSCASMSKRSLFQGTELAGLTLSSDVVKTGEQLRIGNLPSSGTYTIQVLDVVGRAVATETREVSETGGDIMIPTDGWRSGLYLVRITHGDAAMSHRISVVR